MQPSQGIGAAHRPAPNYSRPISPRPSFGRFLAGVIISSATYYAVYYVYKNWKWSSISVSRFNWKWALVIAGAFVLNVALSRRIDRRLRKQEPASAASDTNSQSPQNSLSRQVPQKSGHPSANVQKQTVRESETKESIEHRQQKEEYEALLSEISKLAEVEKIEALSTLLKRGFVPNSTDTRARDAIFKCWSHNETFLGKYNRGELNYKIEPEKISTLKARNRLFRSALDEVGNKYMKEALELNSKGQTERVSQLKQLAQTWLTRSIALEQRS